MNSNNTDHKNEIEATRVGGFGGSDAKMFYKIGLKGLASLNNTDKKRIRVAKGIDEYKPITVNEAMQRGHDFEDWYEKQPFAPLDAEREVAISSMLAKNFKTFAHADFFSNGEVWELKCLGNPENAYNDYFEQLQWYHRLRATKVWLVVADSSKEFEDGVLFPIEIKRDNNVIDILSNGIKLLDQNWDTLDLEVGEEWTESDLLPFEKEDITVFASYLQRIQQLEELAEESKSKVFNFMKENGIKSLKSDYYTVTFIPESTTATLDKKKLFTAHPEIKEQDYIKTSPKKAYITVKLK